MNTDINWDLFGRIVTLIEENPKQHRQETWHCGTAHCFAGWAQMVDMQDRGLLENALECSTSMDRSNANAGVWDREFTDLLGKAYGRGVTVSTVAKGLLRLDQGQADWLFDGDRTVEDFRECLDGKIVHSRYDDSDDDDDWEDDDEDDLEDDEEAW